jgi:hypothetical protein
MTMHMFETFGQSQAQLVEGHRQLALALIGGTRRALRQLSESLVNSMRNHPYKHPYL